jgi:hypothetical protein
VQIVPQMRANWAFEPRLLDRHYVDSLHKEGKALPHMSDHDLKLRELVEYATMNSISLSTRPKNRTKAAKKAP